MRRALFAAGLAGALVAAAPSVAAACAAGAACAYQNDRDLAPDSGWVSLRGASAGWTTGEVNSATAGVTHGSTTAKLGVRVEDAASDLDPERVYAMTYFQTGLPGELLGLFAVASAHDPGGGLEPAEEVQASAIVWAGGTTAGAGLEYTNPEGDLSPGSVSAH